MGDKLVSQNSTIKALKIRFSLALPEKVDWDLFVKPKWVTVKSRTQILLKLQSRYPDKI